MTLNSTFLEVLQLGSMGHLTTFSHFSLLFLAVSLESHNFCVLRDWQVWSLGCHGYTQQSAAVVNVVSAVLSRLFLCMNVLTKYRYMWYKDCRTWWWCKWMVKGGWVIVSFFQTDQNYSLQIKLLLVAPCDIYATWRQIIFCIYCFIWHYLILQDSYPDVPDGKRYLCSGGMYMHDCISLGFILSG